MTYTSEKNSKCFKNHTIEASFSKTQITKAHFAKMQLTKHSATKKNSNNTLAIAITLKFAKIRFAIIYFVGVNFITCDVYVQMNNEQMVIDFRYAILRKLVFDRSCFEMSIIHLS